MAIADKNLEKIVGLKRKAAENKFRSLSLRLRKVDENIRECELSLAENRGDNGVFSGDLLAAERFTQKLLQELKSLAAVRATLSAEYETARLDLQKIIVSEEVLESSGG